MDDSLTSAPLPHGQTGVHQSNTPASFASSSFSEQAAQPVYRAQTKTSRRARLDDLLSTFRQPASDDATVARTRFDLELELAATKWEQQKLLKEIGELKQCTASLQSAKFEVQQAQLQIMSTQEEGKTFEEHRAQLQERKQSITDLHSVVPQLKSMTATSNNVSADMQEIVLPRMKETRHLTEVAPDMMVAEELWMYDDKVKHLLAVKAETARRVAKLQEEAAANAARRKQVQPQNMTFRDKMAFFTSAGNATATLSGPKTTTQHTVQLETSKYDDSLC